MLPIAVHNALKYSGEEGSRKLFMQLKRGVLLTGCITGTTYIFDTYYRTDDVFTVWGYAKKYDKWVKYSYTGYDCSRFTISKYINLKKLQLKLMVEAL